MVNIIKSKIKKVNNHKLKKKVGGEITIIESNKENIESFYDSLHESLISKNELKSILNGSEIMINGLNTKRENLSDKDTFINKCVEITRDSFNDYDKIKSLAQYFNLCFLIQYDDKNNIINLIDEKNKDEVNIKILFKYENDKYNLLKKDGKSVFCLKYIELPEDVIGIFKNNDIINYYLFILMYYYSQNYLNKSTYRDIIKNIKNIISKIFGDSNNEIFDNFKKFFKIETINTDNADYILKKTEKETYILYIKNHKIWYKIDGAVNEVVEQEIEENDIILKYNFSDRENKLDYDLTVHTFPYKKPRHFINDKNNVIDYLLQLLFLDKNFIIKLSNLFSINIIKIINNKELKISMDDILYFNENMKYNLTYDNNVEFKINNMNKKSIINIFSKKKSQKSILDSNYLTIQKKENNNFQKKLCLTNEDTSIKLLCDKFIYFDKDLIPNYMSGGQKKSLLNPKIIQAVNGNNKCWINAPLYAIAAHMNIFKNLHDNVISITKKTDPTRITNKNGIKSCSDKFGTQYEELYEYILKKSNDKWGKLTYNTLIKLINNTTDEKAKFDIPSKGNYGNAQEFIEPLIFSVLKDCNIIDFIQQDNLQIGENNINNNLLKKSVVINDPKTNVPSRTINYELISILKPTNTAGYSIQGYNIKTISHWTCYVKKSNNRFLKFDALDRGTKNTEIEFKDIFNFKNENKNKVYNCTFLYLNTEYLYENNTENNILIESEPKANKEIQEIKNAVITDNFVDYYNKLLTYDNQEKIPYDTVHELLEFEGGNIDLYKKINCYTILGFYEYAMSGFDKEKKPTTREIVTRYRKSMLKHYPNKGGDEKLAAVINHAYESIKEDEKRINYDSKLLEQTITIPQIINIIPLLKRCGSTHKFNNQYY